MFRQSMREGMSIPVPVVESKRGSKRESKRELQEPLLQEHIIELSDCADTPKARNRLLFSNAHLQLYFLQFLNTTEALASYLYLNRTFFNFVNTQVRKMPAELQGSFLEGLRRLAHVEETKKSFDQCVKMLTAELKEPFWRKALRHASWFVPSVGGSGSLIYGAVNRGLAAKAYESAAGVLRAGLMNTKECANYLMTLSCSFPDGVPVSDPHMAHRYCKDVAISYCDTVKMSLCENNFGTQRCEPCYTPCNALRDAEHASKNRNAEMEAFIAAELFFSLVSLCVIYKKYDFIPTWYKERDKQVQDLSQDLQNALKKLGVTDVKMDAQTVLGMLKNSHYFRDTLLNKDKITRSLIVSFGVFQSKLPFSDPEVEYVSKEYEAGDSSCVKKQS